VLKLLPSAPQNVGSVKSLGIFLKISNYLSMDPDPLDILSN